MNEQTIGLTAAQLQTFSTEGCLCIPNFLSPEEVSLLLFRSRQLLEEFDFSKHPMTKFTTGQDNHVGDEYFFDSSDKISYFFDADAFDETGQLTRPKEISINKIGHGLHLQDNLFHKITFDRKVKAIARSLQYHDPRVLQSMCIFKQPTGDLSNDARDNAVPSHTDGVFLFTRPQSAVGFWYALERCTLTNGCLSYLPGSHKTFPITKRFVKVDGGREGTTFVPVEYDTSKPIPEDDLSKYKSLECEAGSLILIHNSVLHKSEKNSSPDSRFAYAFHVIDGVAEYDNLNWLQVPPGEMGGTEFSKLYEE